MRDGEATHTHQAATPQKAPPSWYPGVEHQCGTETAPAQSELAGGLLTGRGGSRPGSAEDAADQPEGKRCPAAGSPSHRHPSPPGSRYSKGSLQRDAVSLSEGFSKGDGPSSGTTESQAPPTSSFLPSPAPGSSPAGLGAAGRSQPSSSLRAGLASCSCEATPGGRIQTEKEREGGAEEGTPTPPSPSREKKKKKNHQGTRRTTRKAEDAEGAGSTPETAVLRSPLRASAPPAAGQRDSEGFPVAYQLTWSDCVCAERSTQPGRRRGGRTHGLSAARRGAASPRRCSASSGGCGRRAGNAAASSACEAGRRTRRGENPPSSPPSPGPSLAPPSPPPASPYLTPLAVTNLPPCPRLAGKRERGGTQGPGSLSWGAGRGGRRAPLPGREAVLKLGIRSVILEPGSNPDCPPPSCRKQNPVARMPSSPVSPPLQIEMVQAPGAPAPRELESGVRLAGLPSGPNTK